MYLFSPLGDAREAVDVGAGHEDAEGPALGPVYFSHHLQTHAALRLSRLGYDGVRGEEVEKG